MNIARTAALALFAALEVTGADKWNPKRMAAKLGKIDEMVDAKTKLSDKAADKTLNIVLKAIAGGEEIEVIDDTAPAADAKKTEEKVDPIAKMAEAKAAQEAAKKKGKKDAKPTADEKAGKKAVKSDADAKGKKDDKPAASDKPKTVHTPGVRETMTRPYCAGVIIKKYGLEAGVTEAMTAEVNAMYGDKNDLESRTTLKHAWHAVRGFVKAAEKK